MTRKTNQTLTLNATATAGVASEGIGPNIATLLESDEGQETTQHVAANAKTVPSIFTGIAANIAASAAVKAEAMSKARQRLAEASDYYRAGRGEEAKGQEAASIAMLSLYNLQRDGLTSAKETSAILVDIFGPKSFNDKGEPSKTPAQPGEGMRKRIVRCLAAHDYVEGRDSKYFDGCDKEQVLSVLAKVEAFTPKTEDNPTSDGVTMWAAYPDFEAIVKEGRETTPFHLNADKVRKLADELLNEGVAAKIGGDKPLTEAYAYLMAVLTSADYQAL